MKVNDFCRAKGACFISCDARGVFAYAFCDFGEAFTVTDVDGNQAASCVVSSVTKDAIGLVTVMDDQRHNLVTGDVVTFNSIQGMSEVRPTNAGFVFFSWFVHVRKMPLIRFFFRRHFRSRRPYRWRFKLTSACAVIERNTIRKGRRFSGGGGGGYVC